MIPNFARRVIYGTSFYDRRLHRPGPVRAAGLRADPWPGDPSRGADLINGRMALAARPVDIDHDPWDMALKSDRAFRDLHDFGWLKDLAALSGDDARDRARKLITGWLTRFGRWQAAAWAPEIIAPRLSAWINNLDFIAGEGPAEGLRRDVITSITAQARHLASVTLARAGVAEQISIGAGLITAGAALEGMGRLTGAGLERLMTATGRLNGDGGLPDRCPETQARALARLIEARTAGGLQSAEAPGLDEAIRTMAAGLKAMTLGDGALALFNGGAACRSLEISSVMSASNLKGPATASLPHTGFERLSAGPVVIIADAGAGGAHAGTASFEMSAGRHRVIVNCGAHPDETTEWSNVLRSTAAHSTLIINDTDSRPGGGAGSGVTVQRNDRDGSQFVQIGHDGYRRDFGIVHNRDLYLSREGDDFRGKDVMIGGGGSFTIRFHMHPEVSASERQGGGVLIRPGKAAGWRFRVDGAEAALEESVYLGDPARPRRSRQIVLRGPATGGETTVRWSFLKEDG